MTEQHSCKWGSNVVHPTRVEGVYLPTHVHCGWLLSSLQHSKLILLIKLIKHEHGRHQTEPCRRYVYFIYIYVLYLHLRAFIRLFSVWVTDCSSFTHWWWRLTCRPAHQDQVQGLPKDTSTCRPGESNQRPSDYKMLALPLRHSHAEPSAMLISVS